MKYSIRLIAYLALLFLSALALSREGTAAPLFRTYLSSTGNDGNACSLVAPCRLLPAALAQTQDGGEVWMLDSANYNTASVDIIRSVTILAIPGALASLTATNADAVNIVTPDISVTLRNLSFRQLGTSGIGVYLTGSRSRLFVEYTEFSGLGAALYIFATGAQANASHTTFLRNQIGVTVYGASQATLDHCTITGPGATAPASEGISANFGNIVVSHSTVTEYASAISSAQHSYIELNDNVIAHNFVGASLDFTYGFAQIQTTGNNTFFNNGTDGAGSLTSGKNQ